MLHHKSAVVDPKLHMKGSIWEFQVLIAHHNADDELIRTIQSHLAGQAQPIEMADASAWVGGPAWPQKLEAKLQTAQAALVFIGKHGLNEGQKRVIGLALEYQTRLEQFGRHFPVIPVLLPEADLAPAFLFDDPWIDLRAGLTNPQALKRLVQAVENPAGQRRPPVVMVDHCPYRGLSPFREEDAAFFFGREALVERLLVALPQHRWITLSGPSGSGKTSLIRAGLLPVLHRQTGPAGRWDIVYVRPLDRPLVQLAAGLLEASSGHQPAPGRVATLADQLAHQERSLGGLIEAMLPQSPDTRLLLAIDQFEELVTSSSPEQGALFFNVLQSALDHPALSLLIALRSENYGQLLDLNQTFADRLTNEVIPVTPLPPEALRQVILRPARLVTMAVEPALVQHLIDTTTNLSRIQFCLTELWRHNRDRLLSGTAYERIGGVTGVMTYRAEQIFGSLTPTQQQMARQILCSLAEGADPADIVPPQRVKLAELSARLTLPKFSTLHSESGHAVPPGSSRAMGNTVIEAFVRGGLLTVTSAAAAGEDEFIELASPALIGHWPRLRIWLDQAQAFRLWRRGLSPALAAWEQSHRRDDLLLGREALFEANRWLRTNRAQMDPAEQAFIRQSVARQRRAQAWRWGAGLAVLAGVVWLITALFLGQFSAMRQVAEQRDLALTAQAHTEMALEQVETDRATAVARQQQVEQQRQVALARQLAVQVRLIVNDPEGFIPQAMILAVESLRRSPSLEGQQVLRAGLLRLPRPMAKLQHEGEVGGAIFSPNGQWLATRSGSLARLWDGATGEELAWLTHDGLVTDIAFSPDSRWLVTASLDRTARMWDVHTAREVARLRHDTRVWEVAFSADGQWLATRSDREVSVWPLTPGIAGPFTSTVSSGGVIEADAPLTFIQVSDGQPRPEITRPIIGSWLVMMWHDEAILAMDLSQDARWLATASSDHTARVWEVATGREIYRLPHQDSVQAVAFSPNGRFLATGGSDNIARLWLLHTAAMTSSHSMPASPKMIRLVHRYHINQVMFSPDSNWLATVSDDNIARVWLLAASSDSKVVTPRLITQIKHQARIERATFSPDGRWLATASADQTARLWLVATGQELAQFPHLGSVTDVVFSPDGQQLATTSTGQTAQLWPATFGYEVAQQKHEGLVLSVDFSPDGRRLATRSEQTVQIWDGATGREITQLKHQYDVNTVAFSPDGQTIATGSYRTTQLWDAATGAEVGRLAHAGQARALAFSPDGRHLATAGIEKIARIWDVETGQVIAELPHQSWITAITFSPDGQWVATASNDKTARVWDAASGQEIARLGHEAVVTQVAFSPDGQWLATASDDHTARIWLTTTVRELVRLPHRDPVLGLAFSPDGRWLATRSGQLAQVWNAATGERMSVMKHDGPVETIVFSPDSQQLATASDERTARVWDVITGQEITRLEHKYWGNAVAFSPDGRWLATASGDHTARVWLLRQNDLLAEVCTRLPRNLTPQEWQSYLPDDPYRVTCPNLPAITE